MDTNHVLPSLTDVRQKADPTFIRLLLDIREAHEKALSAVRVELTSKSHEQSTGATETELRTTALKESEMKPQTSQKSQLSSTILFPKSLSSGSSNSPTRVRSMVRFAAPSLPTVASAELGTSTGSGTEPSAVVSTPTKSNAGLLSKTMNTPALEKEMHKVRSWGLESLQLQALQPSGSSSRLHFLCKCLGTVRNSKSFTNVCGCVIVLNVALLGLIAHVSAHNYKYAKTPPTVLDVTDKCCSIWFGMELLIRLSVGCRVFFCGSERWWNVFEFSLVGLDIVDSMVSLTAAGHLPIKSFVALRALRLFRVLRIVRLLQFCQDLQVMVHCVIMCGKSLLWTVIMVFLIIYLFAIYFMNQVTEYLASTPVHKQNPDHDLKGQWGDLFISIKTLYMVMSGGVDWIGVSEPLIHIHECHGLAFFFYVFFTMFVLTNIITSIFVDTAIQATNGDRESVIARKLKERDKQLYQMITIFNEADREGTGFLSLDNFQQHTNDPRVRAYLRSVDLDVTEATSLFALMDASGSGRLNITEFVFGCMRLKGPARSIDLAMLMHDTRILHDALDEVRAKQNDQILLLECLQKVSEIHDRSRHEVQQSHRVRVGALSL